MAVSQRDLAYLAQSAAAPMDVRYLALVLPIPFLALAALSAGLPLPWLPALAVLALGTHLSSELLQSEPERDWHGQALGIGLLLSIPILMALAENRLTVAARARAGALGVALLGSGLALGLWLWPLLNADAHALQLYARYHGGFDPRPALPEHPAKALWVLAHGMLVVVLWRGLDRHKTLLAAPQTPTPGMDGRHWTPLGALGCLHGWLLLPGLMAPAFWMAFVVQGHTGGLAVDKLWNPNPATPVFWLFAPGMLGGLWLGVWLTRRRDCLILPPLALSTLAAGAGVIAAGWHGASTAAAATLLIGLGAGLQVLAMGLIWARLHGDRHHAALRSVPAAAVMGAGLLGAGLGAEPYFNGLYVDSIAAPAAAWLLGSSMLALLAWRLAIPRILGI